MLEQRKRKPLIVPIFIPYQGCPHRCVYCEQEKISHQESRLPDAAFVQQTMEKALRSRKFDPAEGAEVAFYGGTFTRLALADMVALLEAAAPFLEKGFFRSIRISTRPDAVDEQRLEVLKRYSVTTVELGSQSMNDEVLTLTKRGHTAEDTIRAVYLLKGHGFRVGIQLMPGLPGDSGKSFLETVQRVIALRPDMVRLYPTLVIRGTELAQWYKQGQYVPLPLVEAVSVCTKSCMLLENSGIPVIRIGLMSSPSLQEKGQVLAGPWHEAFGHLVRSEIHFEKIKSFLPDRGEAERIRLRVPPNEVPLVKGYKSAGLRRLEEKTGAKVLGVLSDPSIPTAQVRVERL